MNNRPVLPTWAESLLSQLSDVSRVRIIAIVDGSSLMFPRDPPAKMIGIVCRVTVHDETLELSEVPYSKSPVSPFMLIAWPLFALLIVAVVVAFIAEGAEAALTALFGLGMVLAISLPVFYGSIRAVYWLGRRLLRASLEELRWQRTGSGSWSARADVEETVAPSRS